MSSRASVTGEDIREGLSALGLGKGQTVMVHSSLSSFGRVEGGAPTVVQALLDVLGPEGTLVVPTFSQYLQDGETVWDRENTPSRMGIISETARTWPGAVRSNHAAHSLAAIGPMAELICRTPHRTGFGPDSPFKTLVEMDARVLLMGVTYNSCTLFHLFEAEARVPYRFVESRRATVIIDGIADPDGEAWEYTRMDGVANDFLVLGRELEERGLVKIARIGESEQRLFRAADAYSVGMAKMANDPLYLVTEETKANWQH